jgi:hypothetical protein
MYRRPSSQTPPTADSLIKNEAVLWVACQNCDRQAKADLAAIVARGLGDRSVQALRFRCSTCGSTKSHLQLSSASADRFRPPPA